MFRSRPPKVGRLLFSPSCCKKGTNRGNYGDLVARTRPRKKNHKAVASQQLAPAHVTAPDYDLFTRRKNQQNKQAVQPELRGWEFRPRGYDPGVVLESVREET